MPAGFGRLLGLLVLSGFAGIALEIAWFRRLHLALGSESYSIALVLAAFMAGLGLGSFLFGRIADRTDPVRLYRWLELGIGLYGLASPFLLRASSVPYAFLRTGLGLEGSALLTAKFALSFLLLLPPTLLMGGTLPAAARALTSDFDVRGRAFAFAYGINALGAGIAAVAAPFVLLPRLGLTGTTVLAACFNLAVFVLARGLHLAGETREERTGGATTGPAANAGAGDLALMQIPFFLTGFAALAAETVWNRLFSFFFTSSVYTFSLILSVYLITLAAGSLSYPLVRRRFPEPGGVFAACQWIIAVLLLLSTVLLDRAPLVLLSLLEGTTLSFGRFMNASALTLILFTAPITYLFGLSFPAGVAFATARMPRLGGDIGRLLLWNTFGTAAASIVTTAVLYDALGSRGSLILFAALMVVSHFVVVRAIGSDRLRVVSAVTLAGVVLIGTVTHWNLANFHLRLAQRPQDALQAIREDRFDRFRDGARVLAFEDGPAATVSVVEIEGLYPSMFINGKPDASEQLNDMQTQYLVGLLPVLFRDAAPEDSRVLVIGLGAGVTTNAVEATGVRDLTTIEISPRVVELADRHFQKSNEGVIGRTRVIVDDGRDWLSSTEDRFDVIISEPSNPWISGVSNLFTDEFFAIAADRLTEGGVFCQWMHHYSIDIEAVYGVVATLRRSFDEIHAFLLPGRDLVFVASNRPMSPAWGRIAAPPERVRTMLDSVGFADPPEVFRHYLWTPEVVRALPSTYPPNTDDRPWLEFDAPRTMFGSTESGKVERFVRALPDGRARTPVVLPPADGAEGTVPPLGLDVSGLAAGFASAERGLEVRWTVNPGGGASSRGWIRTRFEEPRGGWIEIGSPLIRAVPAVHDAVDLLRAELGPATRITELEVHGHTAIGGRSPDRPGRSLVFWYCPGNRRSYVLERGAPAGGVVPFPLDVATCVHPDGG